METATELFSGLGVSWSATVAGGQEEKHLTGPTVSQRTALARASRPEMVVDRKQKKKQVKLKEIKHELVA